MHAPGGGEDLGKAMHTLSQKPRRERGTEESQECRTASVSMDTNNAEQSIGNSNNIPAIQTIGRSSRSRSSRRSSRSSSRSSNSSRRDTSSSEVHRRDPAVKGTGAGASFAAVVVTM